MPAPWPWDRGEKLSVKQTEAQKRWVPAASATKTRPHVEDVKKTLHHACKNWQWRNDAETQGVMKQVDRRREKYDANTKKVFQSERLKTPKVLAAMELNAMAKVAKRRSSVKLFLNPRNEQIELWHEGVPKQKTSPLPQHPPGQHDKDLDPKAPPWDFVPNQRSLSEALGFKGKHEQREIWDLFRRFETSWKFCGDAESEEAPEWISPTSQHYVEPSQGQKLVDHRKGVAGKRGKAGFDFEGLLRYFEKIHMELPEELVEDFKVDLGLQGASHDQSVPFSAFDNFMKVERRNDEVLGFEMGFKRPIRKVRVIPTKSPTWTEIDAAIANLPAGKVAEAVVEEVLDGKPREAGLDVSSIYTKRVLPRSMESQTLEQSLPPWEDIEAYVKERQTPVRVWTTQPEQDEESEMEDQSKGATKIRIPAAEVEDEDEEQSPIPSLPHPEFGYQPVPEAWHKQPLLTAAMEEKPLAIEPEGTQGTVENAVAARLASRRAVLEANHVEAPAMDMEEFLKQVASQDGAQTLPRDVPDWDQINSAIEGKGAAAGAGAPG